MRHFLRDFFLTLLCAWSVALAEGLFLLPGYGAGRNGVEWLHALVLYGLFALFLSILMSVVGMILRRAGASELASQLGPGLRAWLVLSAVFLYWLHQIPRMPRVGSLVGALVSILLPLFLLFAVVLLSRTLAHASRRWTESVPRPLVPIAAVLALCFLFISTAVFSWPRDRGDDRQTPPDDAPPVIVVLVDTLRRDHLSVFGYERETSPRLQEFARDCLRFENACAGGSRTVPSIATLFSGVHASTHGIRTQQHSFNSELVTLAESFRNAGYRTGAFVGNGTMRPDMGYARGFDRYVPRPLPPVLARRKTALELMLLKFLRYDRGPRVNTLVPAALGWLDEPSDRPPLLYLHLMEPHSTYAPPPEYAREFLESEPERDVSRPPRLRDAEQPWLTWEELEEPVRLSDEETRAMEALYDGEILWVDHWLGRFFEALEERGLYEDSVILFLSDHGEEFGDHQGWFHGRTLYEEMVGMPLLLKLPGAAVVGASGLSMDTVDLLPTLCGPTGVEAPAHVQGRDYSSSLAGSERELASYFVEEPPHLYALRVGRWKIIERRREGVRTARLFDLQSDPRERVDLAASHPDSLRDLQAALDHLIVSYESAQSNLGAAIGATPSPDTRELLRSLGYVE